MLTCLKNSFTRSGYPSALLVIGNSGAMIHVLHLLPEDGTTIERFGVSSPSCKTIFRHRGATEQAREQLGTVTLHIGDGESTTAFLDDDVEARLCKPQTDCVEVTQLVQDVLKPAALDAIHEREGRDRSMNATQTYPAYVVYIRRSKEGKIISGEQTSIFR